MKLKLIVVAIIVITSGCVPLITGLKHVKTSSGAEYNFVSGFDFSAGANAVDSVNNKRGISPKQ